MGEMVLFLTISMATMPSHANQQYVYVLDTCGRENFESGKKKMGIKA